MLKEERQRLIVERLSRDSRIYVTDLSRLLNVSDDTVRRDLAELEHDGMLTKVHGGAIAKSGISLMFDDRVGSLAPAKRRIAEKIVARLSDGDVILIDGGTTNLEVARQLPADKNFTVYTNSLPIAMELAERDNIDLTMLGGMVFGPSRVTLGIPVLQMLQTVYPDWVVVGVSDLHPQKGLTTSYREEALIKRCMVKCGGTRIVTATADKLGTARSFHVASLNEIDIIATEDSEVERLREEWPKGHYEVI